MPQHDLQPCQLALSAMSAFALHCISLLLSTNCCLWGEHPIYAVRTSSQSGKSTANHFVDLRRVGGPTHKCNEMALRLKTSRHLMHCFPMLLVCPFIGKPTRFDRAQRAFHHRDEAQPHLLLLIASSPVRHQPFFSWCFHV